MSKNSNKIKSLCNDVYTSIKSKFGKKGEKVNRCIRHGCELSKSSPSSNYCQIHVCRELDCSEARQKRGLCYHHYYYLTILDK